MSKEMIQAAINALQNERYVLGESVYKFEEEFAKYCGVKYATPTCLFDWRQLKSSWPAHVLEDPC